MCETYTISFRKSGLFYPYHWLDLVHQLMVFLEKPFRCASFGYFTGQTRVTVPNQRCQNTNSGLTAWVTYNTNSKSQQTSLMRHMRDALTILLLLVLRLFALPN